MRRKLTKKQWQRQKRVKAIAVLGVSLILAVTILGLVFSVSGNIMGKLFENKTVLKENYLGDLNLDVNLLTPNEYSRPQTALEEVKGIVIHYTANPGTDADANRNYFEGLKDSHVTKASSHFVVGLKGNIVQCIPMNEVAYASNSRNNDTIAIEVCHPDKSGKFNKKTYDSLVRLTAWICSEYKIKEKDIIRHYDVTGKVCPKYFVDHEDKWEEFKKDVLAYRKEEKRR